MKNEKKAISKTLKERQTIKVVVMGDEGVGKSSLISTFVSRHFSEVVPGIMTQVKLPPDSLDSTFQRGFVTTIVDTRNAQSTMLAALAAAGVPPPSIGDGHSAGTSSGSSLTAAHSSSSLPSSSSTSDAMHPRHLKRHRASNICTLMGASLRDLDVIVLVYDLSRLESFDRLESLWLPLIECCFGENIPVIIAGTKLDLQLNKQTLGVQFPLMSPDPNAPTTALPQTDRHRIVSLLQNYKFVRQCIKCSARALFHVTEIFLKAQSAVLYPIAPLYNLKADEITLECERALVRIFRLVDTNHDGLLDAQELQHFQNSCARVWGPLMNETMDGWSKILSKKTSSIVQRSSAHTHDTIEAHTRRRFLHPNYNDAHRVMRDGKLTITGFVAIFEIFMSKDRWEIPWQVLRLFGYDDYLNLDTTPTVSSTSVTPDPTPTNIAVIKSLNGDAGVAGIALPRPPGGLFGFASLSNSKRHSQMPPPRHWDLTLGEQAFLVTLFNQFDANHDGFLSDEDIKSIFSVLPEPSLPPWHPLRFEQVFGDDNFSYPATFERSFATFPTDTTMPPAMASHPDTASQSSPLPSLSYESHFTADGITLESVPEPPDNASSALFTVEPHPGTTTSDCKPSADLIIPSMSLYDWLSHWHMCTVLNPQATKTELFRLGYSIQQPSPSTSLICPSITVRVNVFGSTALLQLIEQTVHLPTESAITLCTHVLMSDLRCINSDNQVSPLLAHLVFTYIPKKALSNIPECDVALLAFDLYDPMSLVAVEATARLNLDDKLARMYVAVASENHVNTEPKDSALVIANEYCQKYNLESPLIYSSDKDGLLVFKSLVRSSGIDVPGMDPLRSIPNSTKSKRVQPRSRILWIAGGIIGVGVVVSMVLVRTPKTSTEHKLAWLGKLFWRPLACRFRV